MPVMLRSIGNRVRHGDAYMIAGDDVLIPSVFEQVKDLRRATLGIVAIGVYQAVLTSGDSLVKLLLPGYARLDPEYGEKVLRSSIVYTPWERDRVGAPLVSVLARVGQVWVQCARNRDAFVQSGVPAARVRIVPNAYDPTSAVCRIPTERPIPPSGRRYYIIAKDEPRKNIHGLLGAFLRAFRPMGSASLTIKTSPFGSFKDHPTLEQSVYQWLEDGVVRANGWSKATLPTRVRIDQRLLTDDQIAHLHAINNIYVSSGFAEGWDYPAFDARCAGNRLVYVGFGGPEEYADGDNDERIRWTEGPVHPGYGWEQEARWASYDVDELARALKAAEPPTRRAPPMGFERFQAPAVGELMRECVLDLAAENNAAVLEKLHERVSR